MEDDKASQNDSGDEGGHGGSQDSDMHGMTDLIAAEASSISKMNVQVYLYSCYYSAVSLSGLPSLLLVSTSHSATCLLIHTQPPPP